MVYLLYRVRASSYVILDASGIRRLPENGVSELLVIIFFMLTRGDAYSREKRHRVNRKKTGPKGP
jgi:hypothetical protein